MSDQFARFNDAAPAGAADENALLRASLAEAQRRIEALEQAADVDPLTGLADSKRFRRGLERIVAQAERHGTIAAMLTIDLRGLADLNERHGRLGGDAALVHVAGLVAGLIRSTDLLARLGGSRFGLLLDHLDHDSAIDAAERLSRCIAARPLAFGGAPVSVEAAIAATSILAGDTAEGVLERAERNLAFAKEA